MTKKTEFDMLKDDIDEASLNSEILGDMVSEMLHKTFGDSTMERFYNAEADKDLEAKILDAQSKFTSIVLARLYKKLYEEHKEYAER